MKTSNNTLLKVAFFFICFLVTQRSTAQLVAGDIAFTGYVATSNSPANDAFSFVLLTSVPANTVIRFTDQPWGNNNVFNGTLSETTVSLTITSAQPAGTQIIIAGPPTGSATATLALGGSAGTCTGTTLSLSVSGDQVIAYQSAVANVAPFTFISAIHMNVHTIANLNLTNTDATNWDNLPAANQTFNSSFKPTGLTTGTNAIWIGTQGNLLSERNNARFNCTLATAGGANLSNLAGLRAACNNPAFWDAEYATSGALPTWPLPASCISGVLPVKLIGFQAQNNLTSIVIKWKISEEINVDRYEVERSIDGKNFDKIGNVAVQAGVGEKNYSLTDVEGLKISATLIYYRLKSIDIDGKFSYSDIVTVRNDGDKSILVDNFTNPINDQLNFNLTVKTKGIVSIQLTDVNGKIAIYKQLQVNAGRSNISLPEVIALSKGIYLLRVTSTTGTTVTKLIK